MNADELTPEMIDEIEAGREMDALVWKALNDQPIETFGCRYVDGDVQPHAGYPIGHISPLHYSTDEGQVVSLLAEMMQRGYKFIVSGDPCYETTGGAFTCGFSKGIIPDWIKVTANAKTLSLAICRALLKTVVQEPSTWN